MKYIKDAGKIFQDFPGLDEEIARRLESIPGIGKDPRLVIARVTGTGDVRYAIYIIQRDPNGNQLFVRGARGVGRSDKEVVEAGRRIAATILKVLGISATPAESWIYVDWTVPYDA
jgi:hypothetical protein